MSNKETKKETRHLVKLVRDEKTYYSEFDSLSQAEDYCKGVTLGAECTIYAEVKKYNKYQTLREYIKRNESGAYHTFVFIMPYYNDRISVKVDGIWDFEKIYQPKLLDMFYIISDNATNNGGNCENYHCTHKLELKMIEDNE